MVDMDTGEERRGRLRLNQLLKLTQKPKLMHTMAMVWAIEDMDIEATMVTAGHTMVDMDTGEEKRGRLRLSQLPLLKLNLKQTHTMDTMAMEVWDMEAMAMEDTMATDHTGEDMDSGEGRREKLRLNHLPRLNQKPTLTMVTMAMEDMVDITDLMEDTTDLM